ncbi:MAG: hypothetical protein HEQ39_05210 [Rhizobacter sp.]
MTDTSHDSTGGTAVLFDGCRQGAAQDVDTGRRFSVDGGHGTPIRLQLGNR